MENLQEELPEQPKENIIHALLEYIETEALAQLEPGQNIGINYRLWSSQRQ